jgi:hypothetical protein
MRLLPRDISGTITFFATHVEIWADHAVEIGTTPDQVAALTAKTDEVRANFAAQQAAQSAARAATARLNSTLGELVAMGSDIVKQIRTKAAIDGDAVYSVAKIPPPAAPSPIAAPGTPSGFRFSVDAIGAVTIRWDCKNPRGSKGTVYQVKRQTSTGAFDFLGVTGEKKFRDSTLPRGGGPAGAVTYEVTAVRSTRAGTMGRFTVQFGGGRDLGAFQGSRVAA